MVQDTKMTEYYRESESLTIHHRVMYKCLLKPDTNKYRIRSEM